MSFWAALLPRKYENWKRKTEFADFVGTLEGKRPGVRRGGATADGLCRRMVLRSKTMRGTIKGPGAKRPGFGPLARKGLVASPSDLLLAHAAWIAAEIPQKPRSGFEELERIAPLKNAIRAVTTYCCTTDLA
ncbi:MAG: hypothetical protein LBC67_05860 [Spirochaetales bacterium]|jgi:hypothetical protein|nr:hypothetical protein [Spirochaetales bacterium]